jgi:hypothetical protein
MSKFIINRLTRVFLAAAFVVGYFIIGSINTKMSAGASVAHAANRCGTSFAGRFGNYSDYGVKVRGDTADNRYLTVTVAKNRTAADYGICDADDFMPTANYYFFITTGVYEFRRANDQWNKIGAATKQCSNSGNFTRDGVVYPLVCTK